MGRRPDTPDDSPAGPLQSVLSSRQAARLAQVTTQCVNTWIRRTPGLAVRLGEHRRGRAPWLIDRDAFVAFLHARAGGDDAGR